MRVGGNELVVIVIDELMPKRLTEDRKDQQY